MRRDCLRCGKTYDAQRATSKYCGGKCRALAAQERKAAPVVELTPEVVAKPGALGSAAAAELEAAGRTGTALGQAALALAHRIDSGQDTGAAVAALVRELRVTLEQALDGAPQAADLVDELKARRVARLHA